MPVTFYVLTSKSIGTLMNRYTTCIPSLKDVSKKCEILQYKNLWTDERTDGWIDRQTDGQMVGWTDDVITIERAHF